MDVLDTVEKVAEKALPWYIRYWRQLGLLALALIVGGYIALLNHELNVRDQELKVANDTLVRITAEYKSDVAHLKEATAVQNAAVDILEQDGKDAKTKVDNATTKSNTIRTNTDKQVLDILSQKKAADCNEAVKSLVGGVADLQWSAIK